MCASLGRPSNYIGAPPCRIASVRTGGIAAGIIAVVRRVARLVLTFPGDLATASPAFKARIIDRVTTELNTLLGDGAVTGVVLSSGSILATASFADDVEAETVDAAASSAGVTELTVLADDGSTVAPSAVTVDANAATTATPPTTVPDADGTQGSSSANDDDSGGATAAIVILVLIIVAAAVYLVLRR